MTTQTLADKIQRARDRLAEIETERARLEADDFSRKADLIDEERVLSARLAEMRDEAAREGVGVAQEAAGRATGYERVPRSGGEPGQKHNDTDGDQR